MELKTENPQTHILAGICGDLFSLAAYLRESQNPDRSNTLYNGILDLFATMEQKAKDAKIPEVDIKEAKLAIVAFIDETLQWESRLEMRYFNANIAGDEFFDKLDEMLKQVRGSSEPPYNILEIYYICLTLGFGGMYIGDSDRLQEYIRKLQDVLDVRDPKIISPNGKRPAEIIKKQRNKLPNWIIYSVMGASVLLIIIVFGFLKIRIITWAVEVIKRILSFLH
jgi:type VI secretion system protein ImpK